MKKSLASHRTAALIAGVAVVAAILVVVFVIAGVGSDHSEDAKSDEVDVAFSSEMVPHHESAVEMAKIARTRADHAQIKTLADNIIRSQTAEIAQLKAISGRLGADESQSEHGGGDDMHDSEQMGGSQVLGLTEAQMGMEHDIAALKTARPFDREFIDMMIPHHQGAIRMARVELEKGEDPEAMQLAKAIIAAQSKEIAEMNEWRRDWYGEPSPAGGVPAATDSGGDSEHGGSGGHGG